MRDIFSKTEGRKSLAFLPGAAHLPHPSLDDLKTTITKKKTAPSLLEELAGFIEGWRLEKSHPATNESAFICSPSWCS